MSGMRSSRRTDDHDEEHENSERWLLTYADMITLLLALFMVLFALSSVSANKFAAFKTGLVSAFHSSANSSPTTPGGTGLLQQSSVVAKPLIDPHPDTRQLRHVERRVQKALIKSGQEKSATLHVSKQGLTIQVLTDKVFFASGRAGLEASGRRLIDTVGKVVATAPNPVEVRGYTDDTPIAGGQLGNFALSSARANSVLERLSRDSDVATNRMSATGNGPNHPIESNATAAGRARNRRVDIVLLPETSTS